MIDAVRVVVALPSSVRRRGRFHRVSSPHNVCLVVADTIYFCRDDRRITAVAESVKCGCNSEKYPAGVRCCGPALRDGDCT